MELSKILLPVDFSERSAGAAHYAKSLACRFKSELIIAHAFELREVVINVPEAGVPPNWYEDRRRQTEQALADFQADEFRNMNVRRVLLDGDVAHTIVEFAHSEHADLIVMPTHGYGRFRRFILGSITAKVLHDADCPVLTGVHINETPSLEPLYFREIVCAIDFNPAGERALRWASGFARACEAHLTLVHALPSIQVTEMSYHDQALPKMYREIAQQKCDELQESVGTTAKVILDPSPVPKAVHDAASRSGADLVVIGRHEDTGLMGRLRANAYTIVRESPCPVVSV
jgi:nucleotide-binding universal stress UspA family protein